MTGSVEPHVLLLRWIEDARVAGVGEPTAAVLATADGQARPSARVVLVRGVTATELRWFTNYRSRKGRDLAANPRAALCFHWAELRRQIRVEGSVGRVSEAESNAYFDTRPRESQLATWASNQSEGLADRQALLDEFARRQREFGDKEIPRPSHWGGYGLLPDRWEFWIGAEHRLHERTEFVRGEDGSWFGRLLAP